MVVSDFMPAGATHYSNDLNHEMLDEWRRSMATEPTRRSGWYELQYKCQLFLEFSIENAEIMENSP